MTTSSEYTIRRQASVAPLRKLRDEIDQLRGDIASGQKDFSQVLLNIASDPATDYAYVVKLLEVVEGVGKVQARKILLQLQIGETDRLDDVSLEQRTQILKAVSQ